MYRQSNRKTVILIDRLSRNTSKVTTLTNDEVHSIVREYYNLEATLAATQRLVKLIMKLVEKHHSHARLDHEIASSAVEQGALVLVLRDIAGDVKIKKKEESEQIKLLEEGWELP